MIGDAGTVVAYRHAAYDTPWWANPNSQPGRFNRAEQDATQYWCLHPLGPAAEMLRKHLGRAGADAADTVLLNLWAAIVPAGGLAEVTFDTAADHGITPDELVGDDHGPTRQLADRLRLDGYSGAIVPSASLPGTDNLVLFGARVLHPYLAMPVTPEEVPTGHLSDVAQPAAEAVALVRWFGEAHSSLEAWKATGHHQRLDDPMAMRW